LKSFGNRWPRRTGLVILAAVAVFIASTLFGGPTPLDLPSLKREAERKLSLALKGHISWDALQVRLLPSPHVVLRGLAVEIPGQTGGRADLAEARLRLLSLLRGDVEFTAIRLVRPSVWIDVSAPGPEYSQSTGNPLAMYRDLLGPALQAIHKAAPGTVLELSDASVELRGPALSRVPIRGLWLLARTDDSGADLQASGGDGGPWEKMSVRGRVDFADVSGHFSFEVIGLHPQPWLDRAFADTSIRLDIPRANLRAELSADGRSALKGDFRLEIASMNVARNGHGLAISNSSLAAGALVHADDSQWEVTQLRLGSLVPDARATLRLTSSAQRAQAELEIPKLDVRELRDAVLTLASDNALVRRHVPRLLGGDIVHATLRTEGKTWQELFDSGHLTLSAKLADVSLIVPAIEQEARALSGQMALSDANFELAAARARLGDSELREASLRYSMREQSVSASFAFDVDLAQGVAAARKVLSPSLARALQDVQSPAGRLQGGARLASASGAWTSTIDVTQSSASLRLPSLPWPLALTAIHVEVSPREARISALDGAVGLSTFAGFGAALSLGGEPRIRDGHGRAWLALAEIYPWLRTRQPLEHLLRDIDSVSGTARITLQDLAVALREPRVLGFDAIVQPDQAQVQMKQLPGPIHVSGGSVHVDPDTVELDHVATAMLDARALLSGAINDYRGQHLRVRAKVADATMGEISGHWLWQQVGAPAHFEPKTPLRIAAEQVTWSPGEAVQAQGELMFPGGPNVTAELDWQPNALNLRRVVIRDHDSDATIGLRLEDRLIDATFSGTLFAESIAAMLKRPGDFRGRVAGDLQLTLDLARSGRSSARGYLVAGALQWEHFFPAPVRIDRLDLSVSGSSLRVREASGSWAQQPATFRGEITRGERNLIVHGELDSPGVVVDELLQGLGSTGPPAATAQNGPGDAPGAAKISHPWTLPVRGEISVRSGFVQYRRYRFAPVTAVLAIREQSAELRVQDAQLCGISLPMTVAATPAGWLVSGQLLAQKQQLGTLTRCLTDERVLLTGEFDLRANLTTKGRGDELLKNLEGTLQFASRDGEVRKFALIGNILAMTDLIGLLHGNSPDAGAEGFAYRALSVEGHFRDRRFQVEDLLFDSSAFGLAATGSIGLLDRDTQLTALFAPYSRIDQLVRMVPIIGYLVGGSLTSVPMNVSGDIADPLVVPLGPRAVASAVTAFLTRLLSLPGWRREVFAPAPESSPASSER